MTMITTKWIPGMVGFILMGMILGACSGPGSVPSIPRLTSTHTTADQTKTVLRETSPTPDFLSSYSEGVFFGYTYHSQDGNRWVEGKGTFPETEAIDIPLQAVPRWLSVVPYQEGTLWVAVLEEGEVRAFSLQGRDVEEVQLSTRSLPTEMPPLVVASGGEVRLVRPPLPEGSDLTHPVVLHPGSGKLVFITDQGELVLWDGKREVDRLALNALSDGRILKDGQGRVLLLTDPTRRYPHAVLGDDLEATSISLLETEPELRVVHKIRIPPPGVIEGIMPLWVDLNGDQEREILVTVSDPENGARLALYAEDGELMAQGPEVGQGFRWRHQIAAAPLGPAGEMGVVDVFTPHIGGWVEFFQWQDDVLKKQAEIGAYSSHVIGSRNVDMALAGDFDGDGAGEVLVPDQDQVSLAAVRLSEQGAEEVWSLPVGQRMTTNLAGIYVPQEGIALGVGHEGQGLRLWLP